MAKLGTDAWLSWGVGEERCVGEGCGRAARYIDSVLARRSCGAQAEELLDATHRRFLRGFEEVKDARNQGGPLLGGPVGECAHRGANKVVREDVRLVGVVHFGKPLRQVPVGMELICQTPTHDRLVETFGK